MHVHQSSAAVRIRRMARSYMIEEYERQTLPFPISDSSAGDSPSVAERFPGPSPSIVTFLVASKIDSRRPTYPDEHGNGIPILRRACAELGIGRPGHHRLIGWTSKVYNRVPQIQVNLLVAYLLSNRVAFRGGLGSGDEEEELEEMKCKGGYLGDIDALTVGQTDATHIGSARPELIFHRRKCAESPRLTPDDQSRHIEECE
ncbi:hypothetical protein PENSPDRAFT_663918 [Peniophora sp. CONT]|nr:hypothetical protein PENSPDRAFT_663918 [Peniophora sp. CONT]